MNINIDNLLIKKPSFYFFSLIVICIILLISTGDTTWRHIDDYGPLEGFYEADSIRDYFVRFTYGWGTYPPIWEYFTFLSYVFRFLGLDIVRFICFLFGFFSLVISSLITYSICLYIKNFNRVKINTRHNYILETLSIMVNVLNTEIILHSNSNMPYNLATITIQLIILLIINIIKSDKYQFDKNKYIVIKSNYFILFTIFSILLTFQSTIILTSLFTTLLIYLFINKIKIKINYIANPGLIYISYKNLFKDIKYQYLRYIFFLSITFFVFTYISKLLLIIFYFQAEPGVWSYGINDIYRISNIINEPGIYFSKIIFSFKSIITQSIYPFRTYQLEVSIFILLSLIYSFIFLFRKNLAGKYFSIFSIFTILITIFLSSFGNFTFAPTRHTIFLYPLFWIPLILNLEFLLKKFKYQLMIKIFLVFLYLIFSFGCFLSIKEISYSKEENIRILKLLKNADFFLEESYGPFSNMSFNGTKEYNLIKEKKCSVEKISNKDQYKLFMYSHRYPFINNKKQLENLIDRNKDCFTKNSSISILDKIEKKNNKDIEQNNFIFNGGSSLYAYLINVKNKK